MLRGVLQLIKWMLYLNKYCLGLKKEYKKLLPMQWYFLTMKDNDIC